MTRKLASNAEIKKLINDRLKEGMELDGDCREVEVGGVTPYRDPDETGCNWDVYSHRGPPQCEEVVRLIVEKLRAQYNLKDD